MSRFTSYYLYQKYEKVGDGEWTPTYPNEYSISGDSENTMPLVIKSENDANCGYRDPIYRWANTEDTICVFEDEHDYSQDYLTFDIVSAGTITWCASALEIGRYIDYSLDNGETWTTILSYVRTYPYPTWPTINVNVGDKLLVRGTNKEYCINSSKYSYFGGTAYYNLKGNIMSLIYGENYKTSDILPSDFNSYTFSYLFNNSRVINAEHLILPATTLRSYCYSEMFSGCTSLTTAPELPATTLASYCYYRMFAGCTSLTTAPELPATTLAQYCYSNMFVGCTNLTTAPELPATTLADRCYQNMFNGCTSLTTAPELPATTLANYCYLNMFNGCTSLATVPSILPATTLANNCYQEMFEGCTSLTTAPELPATTLTNYCYQFMFYGCTSLNYIKCLATDISANRCTNVWINRVASSGTFVKASSMNNWSTGSDGIPSGWTIQNA